MQPTNMPTQAKSKKVLREVLAWVGALAVALAIALPVNAYGFQFIGVDGPSMLETLQDGERMFVTKFDYLVHDPDRYDVVVCNFPGRGSQYFVKRIVGIPGDVVEVSGGVLYINGEAVDEPYVSYPPSYYMPPAVLTEKQYFVLGDNRAVSNDSHVADVGPLERSQIIGKVRAVVWPVSQWRSIQ